MKLRPLIIFLAIITAFSSFQYAEAANKVQVGAKCSKLGQTVSSSNKIFKCIKSGTKLVWSQTKAPVAKPNPTPTPTVSTADTSVIIKPLIEPMPKPTSSAATSWPIDKTAKSVEDILAIADKSVRTYGSNLQASQGLLEIKAGPNTSMDQVQKAFSSLNAAALFFSQEFKPSVPVIAAGAKETDYDYMYELWKKYDVLGEGFDSSKKTWSRFGEYCNQGSAEYRSQPFFWGCIGPYTDKEFSDIGLRKFAAHEYTHLFQGYLLHIKNNQPIWGMPSLLQEGSADFFGVSLATTESDAQKDWVQYRRSGYFGSSIIGYEIQKLNSTEMSQLLIDDMNSNQRLEGNWYYLGSYITARMVAAKGFDGFVTFMKEAGASRDALAAFKKVYGISFTDFATLVGPELVDFSSLYGTRG